MDILTGKSHQLHHGYYATRLASPKEMNQLWEETRKKESNFFQGKAPWNAVDKRRVGIRNLTEALSLRLSQMIEEMYNHDRIKLIRSLPNLKKTLSDLGMNVQRDLTDLPKSFEDNPQAHLLDLCNRFLQDISSYMNGKPTSSASQPSFLKDSIQHYRLLERAIKSTRPQFEVVSRGPPQISSGSVVDDKKDGIT